MARWDHWLSVAWVPDHLDAVVSDLSVLHRVDDPAALSSAWFFTMAKRLLHYPGAVRFELTQRLEPAPDPAARRDEAPAVGDVPRVRSLDDARALADERRRRRYPEDKWGPMRRVSVQAINALGVPGG